MSLTVYGLAQCSTCQKALAWLREQGVDHSFVDYRAHPIEPALLRQLAAQLDWTRLVNRASLTWRNLPAERKAPTSEHEWLALVAEYPALIKRPLLWDGSTASAGFSEKSYSARFGKAGA